MRKYIEIDVSQNAPEINYLRHKGMNASYQSIASKNTSYDKNVSHAKSFCFPLGLLGRVELSQRRVQIICDGEKINCFI